jgi:hypothetical protein
MMFSLGDIDVAGCGLSPIAGRRRNRERGNRGARALASLDNVMAMGKNTTIIRAKRRSSRKG